SPRPSAGEPRPIRDTEREANTIEGPARRALDVAAKPQPRYLRVVLAGGTAAGIGDIGAATPFPATSPRTPPLVTSCAARTVWITLAIWFVAPLGAPPFSPPEMVISRASASASAIFGAIIGSISICR